MSIVNEPNVRASDGRDGEVTLNAAGYEPVLDYSISNRTVAGAGVIAELGCG